MKRASCLSVCFFLLLGAASANAGAPPPIVYTGILKHEALGKAQRVRLHAVRVVRPGASRPVLSATLVLQLGEFGGPEYVSLHYDKAGFNAANRELFLYRYDDKRGRRLPTVRLRYSEDGATVTGEFHSATEGFVGSLYLKSGWELPEGNREKLPLLEETGGLYHADCPPEDGVGLRLNWLELVPSRILTDRTFPETALGGLTYTGNGICRYDGDKGCAHFQSGYYNLFRDTLELNSGAWKWTCRRRGGKQMVCQSPRYRNCVARKIASNLHQPLPPVSLSPRVATLAGLSHAPEPHRFSGETTCESWNGTYRGLLTHRAGGRKQPVAVNLVTFMVQGPEAPVKCVATASTHLYFFAGAQGWVKMSFGMPDFEFDPALSDIQLLSEEYSDAVLQVRNEGGNLAGNWFSRLFGMVGTLEASKDGAFPRIARGEAVAAPLGDFRSSTDRDTTLHMEAIEAGFEKSSFDPFVQLNLVGYLQKDFADPTVFSSRRPAPKLNVRTGMGSASYDYFTNYFAARGAKVFSGYVGVDEIVLRGTPNGYLMFADPAGKTYPFRRYR